MKQTAMDVLRDAVNLIDSVRVGFSQANERKAERIIAAFDELASPTSPPAPLRKQRGESVEVEE